MFLVRWRRAGLVIGNSIFTITWRGNFVRSIWRWSQIGMKFVVKFFWKYVTLVQFLCFYQSFCSVIMVGVRRSVGVQKISCLCKQHFYCTPNGYYLCSAISHHIAPPRVTECWSIFYDGNLKLMKYYFMLSGKKGFFSSTLFQIVLHTRVRKGFQIAPSFSSSPPV